MSVVIFHLDKVMAQFIFWQAICWVSFFNYLIAIFDSLILLGKYLLPYSCQGKEKLEKSFIIDLCFIFSHTVEDEWHPIFLMENVLEKAGLLTHKIGNQMSYILWKEQI